MNGAELLVAMLQAHDVDVIFGLPGDTGVAFYDALRAQKQIRHVMTRDEPARRLAPLTSFGELFA